MEGCKQSFPAERCTRLYLPGVHNHRGGMGARIVQYDTILYDMTLTREHDTRTRLLDVM